MNKKANHSIGKLIGVGRTAEVYEWGDDEVLKLFNEGFPYSVVENELQISLELYNQSLPVAKAYYCVEHEGRYGIVFERINGISMLKKLSQKPWKLFHEGKKLAELHLAIHKSNKADIPNYKDQLIKDINLTINLMDQEKERIKGYLKSLPDGNTLCHGDFHPDNLLFSNGRYYIIDWLTAKRGASAADVARAKVLLRFADISHLKSNIQKLFIGYSRRIFLQTYMNHYTKGSPIKLEEIEMWVLPIAAARLNEHLLIAEKEAILRYIREKLTTIS